MEEIIQEKISADHLLYVSLKYTKTCDVIMNLLLRWRKMIDTTITELLFFKKREGDVETVSENAVGKLKQFAEVFKDNEKFMPVVSFFEMLKRLENLRTERVGEFRKNVALKIKYRGEEIVVNLEQLKIYAEIMENFISETKLILTKKNG